MGRRHAKQDAFFFRQVGNSGEVQQTYMRAVADRLAASFRVGDVRIRLREHREAVRRRCHERRTRTVRKRAHVVGVVVEEAVSRL